MVLRNNIDRYLAKLESSEKEDYKKLAVKFEDNKSLLNNILSGIKNDKTSEKIDIVLKDLKNDIRRLPSAIRTDNNDVVKAINSLSSILGKPEPKDDGKMLNVLEGIKKALAKKTEFPADRTEEVIKAIENIKLTSPEFKIPDVLNVHSIDPQFHSPPVTNININPLRGFIHTTNQTVTSSLTTLPSYGVLENRRSVMIYNNSSTVTVYIGGSGVTSSNGLPIPPKTYSPSIDSGTRMILYGRTSSSTADIRVLEISNESIGG